MEDSFAAVSTCLAVVDRVAGERATQLDSAAAVRAIADLGRYVDDHAASIAAQEAGGQRFWERIASSTTAGPAGLTVVSLVRRLTGTVTSSARAPGAKPLEHLVCLLTAIVGYPGLCAAASAGQRRAVYDAALQLLHVLTPPKLHIDALAECLYLVLALLRPGDAALTHTDPLLRISGDDEVRLANLCLSACNTRPNVALRPQSVALQVLGCLLEHATPDGVLGQPALANSVCERFLGVARSLTEQSVPNQTLGEGLLRGLTGLLSIAPVRLDAAAMDLINSIVLGALRLSEASMNYQFSRAALFLLRHRARDALAPYTLLCAADYAAALRTLWAHRNKDVRRESSTAVAAFWAALCAQLQRSATTTEAANGAVAAVASDALRLLLDSLVPSLSSAADREAAYALEALYHLLPAVAALHGTPALEGIAARLEERVGALATATSTAQTEALFRQSPYLLAALGQLFSLLPSVSPRMLGTVRGLLDWVLLLYPHPRFFDRDKTVPGILVAVAALLRHPRTPDHALPSLLSERTLELVGEAADAAALVLAGDHIRRQDRLQYMAQLWAKLLSCPTAAVALTEAEAATNPVTAPARQRLAVAFFQACTRLCERAELQVIEVRTGFEATLERMLVDGADDVEPRAKAQYRAFLGFVDFFVGLTGALRPPRLVCDVPRAVLTAWLESLVRGVRRAPHVSGFYVLVYRTVLAQAAVAGQHPSETSGGLVGHSWPASRRSGAGHLGSSCYPLLHRFLRTECLRWVYVYSDELLYQCAMCAVVGVAVAVDGGVSQRPAPSHAVGEVEEEAGLGLEGSAPRGTGAYVRAFSVVMTASTPPTSSGTPDGADEGDVGRFGGRPSLLDENRRYALHVLGGCTARAPAWAAAVLPALTRALSAVDEAAAVRASLQMLAARHGVAIAAELQRQYDADTFAMLCRGARVGGAQGGGAVHNIETRRVATLKAARVPLAPVDSAVHVGHLIPLAARLSVDGKLRVVRTAAAEVLYWCVVWAVGQEVAAWKTAAFTPLLSLAAAHAGGGGSGTDGGAVHEKFYRLLLQTARWYGREHGNPESARALVAVLLGGLGERDAAVRRVATEALLAYALPPAPASANEREARARLSRRLAVLLPQLVAVASGASAWARLGAAHCLHFVLRSLEAAAVLVSTEEIEIITQGAVACACRCVEVAGPGPMEAATCNEVLEMLRRVTAAHHRSEGQQQLQEQRRRHENSSGWVPHTGQAQKWSDTVAAVSALLPALAQLHQPCAVALLSAVVLFASPAATPSSARDSLMQGAVRQLRNPVWRKSLDCRAALIDVVTGGLAAVAALLQSGIVRADDGENRSTTRDGAPEWPRLVAEVLQAVVDAAQLLALADAPLPDALVSWLLQVLTLVSGASRNALSRCEVLLRPVVAEQAVRAVLCGTANAAPRGEECEDDDARRQTAHMRSMGAVREASTFAGLVSARLLAPAQRGLELLRMLLHIAEEARCTARVVNDVLVEFKRMRAFVLFESATVAHDLTAALRSVADAPQAATTIALAAALSQVEVPDTHGNVWQRVALTMQVAPSAVANMLRAVLQDSAALNAAEGEAVCEALLLLLFNTVHEADLTMQLTELFNADAVLHNSSFTDAPTSLYDMEADAVHGGGERGAFRGTVLRCWQRAAAALATPCLVAALPRLLAAVASPATAHRRASEVVHLSRVVEGWLAELQGRTLRLGYDDAALRRVCHDLTTAAPTAEMGDGPESVLIAGAWRAMLLQLVQLLGPAAHAVAAGQAEEAADAPGAALLALTLRVGTPTNMYRLLSSIEATDRAVWGFQVLAAMLTPCPTQRVLTSPPVPATVVDAALRYLRDTLNNALPLRWAELTSAQAKTNGAHIVRAGTALFAALLPHHAGALEPLVPLLAMDDLPQRDDVVVRGVSRAIASVVAGGEEGPQRAVFDGAARLLRDRHTSPPRCAALMEHVLAPLLDAAPASVQLRIFKEEVGQWVREAATPPEGDRVQVQTAALLLLASLHRLCPLADLRGAVNRVFTGGNPESKGRELTIEVLKACRSAWQPLAAPACDTAEESGGGGLGVLPPHQRRYRQAAFQCLTTTLAATQQAEKVFCQCLFQERTVAGWNVLFAPCRSSAAAAQTVEDEVEAELWHDMARCGIPELFTHLTHAFRGAGAGVDMTPGASRETQGTWVHHLMQTIAYPQLSLPARLVMFRAICLHADFFGDLQPRVWDGVAGVIAATPPSSPTGAVVWELMAHLTSWYQRHGVGGGGGMVEPTPGLQRLAAYAAMRLAWRGQYGPSTDSSAVDQARLAGLTALLEQLALRTPQPPLSEREVAQLLADPDYDRRSAVEVLYRVASTCGSISKCGGSRAALEAASTAYTTLAGFLDPAAHPQLYLVAARLVGLEHNLLSQPGATQPSAAVRKLLRDELQSRTVAVLRGVESDTKLNDVLEAMQGVGSEELVYAVLSGTDWLQHHATSKGALTAQALRVLAKAGSYVVDHYDAVHMRLVAAQMPSAAGEMLAGVFTVVLNALPRLPLEALRHVLRNLCSRDVLVCAAAAEEQMRVVFFKTGVAALQRWAVLRGERRVSREDAEAAAEAQAFLTRRGLSDTAPAVQDVLLKYLDTDASGVPATMWERLTALLETAAPTEQNPRDGALTRRGSNVGWVRHASVLLLVLAQRSHNYRNTTFFFASPLAPASENSVAEAAACVGAASAGRRALRQSKHAPLFSFAEAGSGPVAPRIACLVTGALTQACMPASLVPHAEATAHQRTGEETDHREEARTDGLAERREGLPPHAQRNWSRRPLRSHHSAGVAAASAPVPLLGTYTSGCYPDVQLTVQSLLAPLQVLCLHEEAAAACVLTDLISNAVGSPTATDNPVAANTLQIFVAQLVSGGDGATTPTPYSLLTALELVLRLCDRLPQLLSAVDTQVLLRQVRDAVTTAFVAPLPLADAAAAVVERVLALPEPAATAGAPPARTRVVRGWHRLHMALRQGGRDDDALQSAMRVLGGGGAVLQAALDTMEVGGAAFSLEKLQAALHDTDAAPDEVLRYYAGRAAQLLLQWDKAAALTEPRKGQDASREGTRLGLRAQLHHLCGSGGAVHASALAGVPQSMGCGFEWGAALLAEGRWLDCQQHAETAIGALLLAEANSGRRGAARRGSHAAPQRFLAASAMAQLADAARHMRAVVTRSRVEEARADLAAYLDIMPSPAPVGDRDAPLYLDNVLLLRRLVVGQHVCTGSAVGDAVQLDGNGRARLEAAARERIGEWAVQRCEELLRLPVKTNAIATLADRALHASLPEALRCALQLARRRSQLFLNVAMPPDASQDGFFDRFQREVTSKVRQWREEGLVTEVEWRQWAADVAQCEVNLLAASRQEAPRLRGAGARLQAWTAALEGSATGLHTAAAHAVLLDAVDKLLATSAEPQLRPLWLLYARSFVRCVQASTAAHSGADAVRRAYLPVSVRVPRLLAVFRLPPATTIVEDEEAWSEAWAALRDLPTTVWLPWATLLVNTLLQTTHSVLMSIVRRLCDAHEQVVFYPVHCILGAAWTQVPPDLAKVLDELRMWRNGRRMALVTEFATVLDELVEPKDRFAARLEQMAKLVQLHEEHSRKARTNPTAAASAYSSAALQLYEACVAEVMDPAQWRNEGPRCHHIAAQVLAELNRRGLFAADVFTSSAKFEQARREAMEATKSFEDSESKRVSTPREKKMSVYSTMLPRVLRRSATATMSVTTSRTTGAGEAPVLQPVQPTHLLHSSAADAAQGGGGGAAVLIGAADTVTVMKSKQLPKKVDFYTTAGTSTFIVKGGDDTRLDQRIQEVFTFANLCLLVSPRSRGRGLMIRTYAVVPVSPHLGLIGFVPNTTALHELMRSSSSLDALSERKRFDDERVKFSSVQKLYEDVSASTKPEDAYNRVVALLDGNALIHSLHDIAADCCSWHAVRDAFLSTNAAAAVVSYILGVGDRHTNNLMVDLGSGELVAIDFGLAFGSTTRCQQIPELMPFRHTPQLRRVQGVLGDDASRWRMCRVVRVVRAERHTVEGMVAALLTPADPSSATATAAAASAPSQLDVVSRKLGLESPATVMLAEVNANRSVTHYPKMLNGVHKVLEAHAEIAADVPTSSPEDAFVLQLLRLASDPSILTRAFAGWLAYL